MPELGAPRSLGLMVERRCVRVGAGSEVMVQLWGWSLQRGERPRKAGSWTTCTHLSVCRHRGAGVGAEGLTRFPRGPRCLVGTGPEGRGWRVGQAGPWGPQLQLLYGCVQGFFTKGGA